MARSKAQAPAEQEISRLYALPPEDFIKARNEAARDAEDADTAELLRSLRKPSKAASLANLLSREEPEDSATLVELGGALRKAQEELDGGQLRELSRQRRELVRQLRTRAASLSEESVSDAIGRQLEDIFQAVLSNAGVAEAFTAGRISGVPEADELNPFAGMPSSPAKRKSATASRSQSKASDREAVKAAKNAEKEATAAAQEAQDRAEQLRSAVAEHQSRLQELEDEIAQLRPELTAQRKELRSAEHSAEVAERRLDEARSRLAKLTEG